MRTTKTLSISMPPAQLKDMEKLAKKENRTMSELIREALRRYEFERRMEEINACGRARAEEVGLSESDVVRVTKEVRKQLARRQTTAN